MVPFYCPVQDLHPKDNATNVPSLESVAVIENSDQGRHTGFLFLSANLIYFS